MTRVIKVPDPGVRLLVLHQLHVHQTAHVALVLCPDVEGGMYPAVVVQHFALYPAARLTIDRVPEILFCHADDARSEEQAHCDSVVKPEHEVVDGEGVGLDHGLDVAGDVHHDGCSLCPPSHRPSPTVSHHPSLSPRLRLRGIIGDTGACGLRRATQVSKVIITLRSSEHHLIKSDFVLTYKKMIAFMAFF